MVELSLIATYNMTDPNTMVKLFKFFFFHWDHTSSIIFLPGLRQPNDCDKLIITFLVEVQPRVMHVRIYYLHTVEHLILNISQDITKVKNVFRLVSTERYCEVLNTPINLNINMPGMARISGAWTSMKDGFYSGMEYMQKDITDIGKDVHSQWEALIAKIPSRTRYTANTPVAELEAVLRAELAMEVVA